MRPALPCPALPCPAMPCPALATMQTSAISMPAFKLTATTLCTASTDTQCGCVVLLHSSAIWTFCTHVSSNIETLLAATLSAHLPSHSYMLTQACPCTQTAVCQSDNLWLTDQQGRFKFNSPGHGYNFHKGTVECHALLLMQTLKQPPNLNMYTHTHVRTHARTRAHTSKPPTLLLTCYAESMLTDMLWRKLGLLPTDPGYGYFRPHVRLFDPGWRGPLVRGNRLEITADYGNDPIGLISRVIKKIGPLE